MTSDNEKMLLEHIENLTGYIAQLKDEERMDWKDRTNVARFYAILVPKLREQIDHEKFEQILQEVKEICSKWSH